MTKLRERMMHDLKLGGYAERTQRKYICSIKGFAAFHHKRPATMSHEDVRRWVEHLNGSGLSVSALRGHHAALRFLFAKTLGRPEMVSFICSPRAQDRLPEVLSSDEV
jgi:integrase/recombinase XerD